jgi:cytochrome c oxidase subunit 1
MSTVSDTINGQALGATEAGESYLGAQRGILSWIFTLDHKRIGVMYLVSILSFFLVGVALALLIRAELWTPAGDLFTADTYHRIFTLHGAIMVFLCIIPLVPASLGNIFLPLQIGANNVAFPRVNLLGFWTYLFGAIFLLMAILHGSIDTGWTFYIPYSSDPETGSRAGGLIWALLGLFILGFSSILTGVNFIVTIHKMRAPGMTWTRMPLFLWALYATAVIQLLATPILALALVLLTVERTLGIGIFDPALGGDPVLFQHFFWFYSHPAVYVMILPGMGIISELITVHSRKKIFGYKPVAYSSMAIAAISLLVWGQHLFVSGQSELASAIFSALALAVAVPTAIKIFNWVATLYKGSIAFTTPMLYALTFIVLFTLGGLGGLFLATLSTSVHLHGTSFSVAHFHYVLMGGTVIAFLGGLHHWWPKITGKIYSERWGRLASALIFIGVNLTFFNQFVMGAHGMPRRYHGYDKIGEDLLPLFERHHQLSTIGAVVLALGLVVVLLYLLHSLLRGEPAPANPWGGRSLEWQTGNPPITHNFATPPICTHGPYAFDTIEPEGPGAGASTPAEAPQEPDGQQSEGDPR